MDGTSKLLIAVWSRIWSGVTAPLDPPRDLLARGIERPAPDGGGGGGGVCGPVQPFGHRPRAGGAVPLQSDAVRLGGFRRTPALWSRAMGSDHCGMRRENRTACDEPAGHVGVL
jgi:hypothetical protein